MENERDDVAPPDHPLQAWFGLPVSVQLRGAYVLCKDQGPREIPLESGGTRTYGTPIASEAVLVALTGNLQPDGERVVLYMETDGAGIKVSLDPRDIAYLTVIHEPKQRSSLITP